MLPPGRQPPASWPALRTGLQQLLLPDPRRPAVHDRRCRCPADVQPPRLPAPCAEGDPANVGHVITTTGGAGPSKQVIRYLTERVVGNGSFGVVFQAKCLETGETVRFELAAGRANQAAGCSQLEALVALVVGIWVLLSVGCRMQLGGRAAGGGGLPHSASGSPACLALMSSPGGHQEGAAGQAVQEPRAAGATAVLYAGARP